MSNPDLLSFVATFDSVILKLQLYFLRSREASFNCLPSGQTTQSNPFLVNIA